MTNLDSYLREIPQMWAPLVRQAILNMYIQCSDDDLLAGRQAAYNETHTINREFDNWNQGVQLAEKRRNSNSLDNY
jgi:hypothetical protein